MSKFEKSIIEESIKRLDDYLYKNNWKAYDPFDGLNSKLLARLTFSNHYLRIIQQQFIRRFPINLRPILRIKKETSSKGMGFCALGYLKLYETTQDDEFLEKMKYCLDWLTKNYCKGYSGFAWGNHFSYESRGGKIPLGVPTIVWTSLIGNVFFDAYEITNEKGYYKVGESACEFILNDMGRYIDSENALCFMYTPQNKESPTFKLCIHNSNALGAWLLSRLYAYTHDKELRSITKKSINYALKYQLEDGGWYYGEYKNCWWIDSFHTGYVLDSIFGYMKATGDMEPEDKLIKGFKFFLTTFFEQDGTPRYYNNKTYPIDIQCASQGIQTLVKLKGYDPNALKIAKKVALWIIKNMQDPEGYFYFRKYPIIINKTPTFHWGQATMLSALAHLLGSL